MTYLKDKYIFVTDCVHSCGEDISDMVDRSKEISYKTFAGYVDIKGISDMFGYGKGMGLSLQKDYHVRYYKSKYKGCPCVYMDHSAIEYVFVDPNCWHKKNPIRGGHAIMDKVMFRRWKDNKDVIAILPGQTVNYGRVMTYMHIGQHGEGDPNIIRERTKPAYMTEPDVRDLHEELKSIGYNLKVVQRLSYTDLRSGWVR